MKICHLTSVHTRYDIRIFKKECSSAAKAGFDVSLIVADGQSDETINGVKIYGVPKAGSRLKRFLGTGKVVYEKALQLNAQIYHFHDPELFPYGIKLRKKGKKVIFDSHEDLPRALLSKPYLSRFAAKIISAIMEKYENYCCRKYDAVVTATPFINERFKKINTNSVNVNNFPFLDEFNQEGLIEKKSSNKVCYVGGVTKIRGLHFVIMALDQSRAILHLAGGIASSSYQQQLQSENGWEKVKYHGNVSREKVKEILGDSVAGIVTFLPVPNHINAQPNKLFEYMSAGIPVIASNYPLWKGIVEKYKCGICVDPESSNEIANAIEYIVKNPNEAKRMGVNGRNAIEQVFNWEQEEKKLIDLYWRLS